MVRSSSHVSLVGNRPGGTSTRALLRVIALPRNVQVHGGPAPVPERSTVQCFTLRVYPGRSGPGLPDELLSLYFTQAWTTGVHALLESDRVSPVNRTRRLPMTPGVWNGASTCVNEGLLSTSRLLRMTPR